MSTAPSPRRRRVLSVVLLALAHGGCGDDTPAPTERASEAPAEIPLFQRSRPLMGTIFQISAVASPAKAGPAVDAAFDEIARLEDVLSAWRPTSAVSKVNAAAGKEPVHVDADTLRVVQAGLDVSRRSGGAFDLSWAALRGLYDFEAKTTPDRAEILRRLPLIDYERVIVDDTASTVFLAREGMAISSGGIGKGYALDRAGDILVAAGIENFMLNAGGQVQVHGTRNGRSWRVGIQHPRQPSPFGFVESAGGSISTSGDYERFFIDTDGSRVHHIIDTDTGLPVEGTLSVTVLADEGVYADALSTAVFVMGADKGFAMLGSLPFRAEAIVVDASCRVHTTPGTRQKLIPLIPLEDNGTRLPGCEVASAAP
jgi:thiamine biosynthesis lipoprotein